MVPFCKRRLRRVWLLLAPAACATARRIAHCTAAARVCEAQHTHCQYRLLTIAHIALAHEMPTMPSPMCRKALTPEVQQARCSRAASGTRTRPAAIPIWVHIPNQSHGVVLSACAAGRQAQSCTPRYGSVQCC